MTTNTPATAWRYHKRGLLPAILKKEEVQLPPLKDDEVLVKVHAAALNPVDWKVASVMPGFIQRLPRTAAADFSGEIVKTNVSSSKYKSRDWITTGSRVYGIIPRREASGNGRGTLSTYVAANCSALAPIPDGMSYQEAAGITLTGVTAATLAALVKKGDKVLILGGTTSVGIALIQMCVAEGASRIVATASTEKMSIAKSYGADRVIDYHKEDVSAVLKQEYGSDPFDHVLDTVGSFETYNASPAFLKPTGNYANVGASSLDVTQLASSAYNLVKNMLVSQVLPTWLGGTPRKYAFVNMDMNYMDKVGEYTTSGKVKPKVDSVFKFDQAPKAYEHLIKGRALGKVVVNVIEE